MRQADKREAEELQMQSSSSKEDSRKAPCPARPHETEIARANGCSRHLGFYFAPKLLLIYLGAGSDGKTRSVLHEPMKSN